MTVSATDNFKRFSGSGSTGPFTWSWRFMANDDIEVTRVNVATGAETGLVEWTDYTLTGEGSYQGGSITLTDALAVGETLVVQRNTERTQEISIRNQGNNFRPEVHEDAFDKLTMIAQDMTSRMIQTPVGEPGEVIDSTGWANRVGKVLGFNALGKLVVMAANFVTSSGALGNPWADVRGYDDIVDAVTQLGGLSIDLVIPDGQAVNADLEIPANIRLVRKTGGLVTIASGKTLTLHTQPVIGDGQFFAGDGSVAGLKKSRPEWFGMVADWNGATGTDNTASFKKAALATVGPVIARAGRYRFDGLVDGLPGNFDLRSDGGVVEFVATSGTETKLLDFNAKNNIRINGLNFKTIVGSTVVDALFFTTCTDIDISHCDFDYVGIAGTNSTGTIAYNTFHDQWGDHAYNAGTGIGGRNNHRAVDLENLGQTGVTVTRNKFTNVYTAIAISNTNDLEISHNYIKDTADSAIFDRCTSGTTYRKNILFNTIINCGKAAIKTLDSNNLTAHGYGSKVVGNTIRNWGLYLSSGAILAAGYLDYGGTDSYLEATEENKQKDLLLEGNSINEDDPNSCGFILQIINISGVKILNNKFQQSYGAQDITMASWCSDVTISKNDIVSTVAGVRILKSSPLKIEGNIIKTPARINFDDMESSIISYEDNYLDNTNADFTTLTSFGIGFSNTTNFSCLKCIGNTFKTTLAAQDGTATTNRNIIAAPTASHTNILADNNVVIFSDAMKIQKTLFGSLQNPVYYGGVVGSATYNSGTRVLTVNPTGVRAVTDTITLTD